MAVELHLPDLPEVPIQLGAPGGAPRPPRPVAPWHRRLLDTVSAYLPLLLMVALALATAWLVKQTPGAAGDGGERPARLDPDYTMNGFAIERFDAAGRLALRLEGEQLRHFPGSDRIEVDAVRIRSIAPDGRVTVAQARRAIGNGDGSELQLVGGAEVVVDSGAPMPVTMRGEFLHVFLVSERVRSHLPVTVWQGASELRAGGLAYDHGARRLELGAPVRAVFAPRGAAAPRPPEPAR